MNPYIDITNVEEAKMTTAKRSIYRAFLELYEIKDYRDISVTGLCNRAGVARTTFYASYDSIDDLMAEMEDTLVYHMLEVNNGKNESYPQRVLEYTEKNREMLRLFLIKQPNIRLMNKMKKAVKYHFWNMPIIAPSKRQNELVLEMVAAMTLAGYTYSVEHLEKPDIKNMSVIINSVLNTIDDES